MAYGIQAWDNNNDLVLDSAGNYTRLVYFQISNSDGSINLPAIDGHSTVQWGETLGDYSFGPIVTRSGTTISWDNRTGSSALILVFLYT